MSKLKRALAWAIIWTGRTIMFALYAVLALVLAVLAYLILADPTARLQLLVGGVGVAALGLAICAGMWLYEWAHRALGRGWPL